MEITVLMVFHFIKISHTHKVRSTLELFKKIHLYFLHICIKNQKKNHLKNLVSLAKFQGFKHETHAYPFNFFSDESRTFCRKLKLSEPENY